VNLETTETTGKNNERTPKECCFKQLFPIIKKLCGEFGNNRNNREKQRAYAKGKLFQTVVSHNQKAMR
jgi:ribosomal protein L37E